VLDADKKQHKIRISGIDATEKKGRRSESDHARALLR
jgi:endonuclease YncB( thermonuclease family)